MKFIRNWNLCNCDIFPRDSMNFPSNIPRVVRVKSHDNCRFWRQILLRHGARRKGLWRLTWWRLSEGFHLIPVKFHSNDLLSGSAISLHYGFSTCQNSLNNKDEDFPNQLNIQVIETATNKTPTNNKAITGNAAWLRLPYRKVLTIYPMRSCVSR